MKLVIHAGFPNTHAWAFQAACAEARPALADAGVCYADLSEPFNGRGHGDLAAALARDDFDAVDRLLGAIAMQGIVRQCRVVLLSAEEFSGPDMTAERLERLRRHARECFDAVELVVLVRSRESLARHMVRQALPHFAFAFWNNEGHAARMAAWTLGQQERFRAAAGPLLREVEYDALVASGRLCNGTLRACVPELPADVAVLAERPGEYDAPNLDPYAVFAPLLRAGVAKAQGVNPYAPSVQAELERLLPREALRALVSAVDMARVGALVAGAIESAVAEAAQSGGSAAGPRLVHGGRKPEAPVLRAVSAPEQVPTPTPTPEPVAVPVAAAVPEPEIRPQPAALPARRERPKIGPGTIKLLQAINEPVPADPADCPLLRSFDWEAHGVTHPYAIFMTGRCGSTWLTTVLKNTGLAGHPMEFLSPEVAHRESRRGGATPEGIAKYFSAAVRREAAGGRFGLEVDAERLGHAEALVDWRAVFPPDRVTAFFLHRRDIVAQAWSWVSARKTGIFHVLPKDNYYGAQAKAPKDTSVPTHAELAREIVRIREGEEYLQGFFARVGYTPFFLDYELLMTELTTEVATMLRLLGYDDARIAAAPIVQSGATTKLQYSDRQSVLADFTLRHRDTIARLRRDRFGLSSVELARALA